jgi:hypothetical protein
MLSGPSRLRATNAKTNPRAAGRGMVLAWHALTCPLPLQGGAGAVSNDRGGASV